MIVNWDVLDSVAMIFGYTLFAAAALVVILVAYVSAKEFVEDIGYRIWKKKRQRQREREEQEKEGKEVRDFASPFANWEESEEE